MGHYTTEEFERAALITQPLIDQLKNEDGLVELSHFTINDQIVQEGTLQNNKILLPHEPDLIRGIKNLSVKYPENDTYLYIEPFRWWVKAAILTGLNLEKILLKDLKNREKMRSQYLVYSNVNGKEIAKIEFEIEKRTDKKHLFTELLWPDHPVSRSIHLILNKDNLIEHIDGAVRQYTDVEYRDRVSTSWNFSRNIFTQKKFRIDGELPLQELNYLSKIFFRFSTPYFRITKMPEPVWSKAKRKILSVKEKISEKIRR